MNRIAILIGSPTKPYLEGVAYDLENVKNYLKSSNGGAWKDNEFFAPKLDPSIREISPYLENCKNYDFAFVYFSGHGFTDSNGNATVVLNQRENLFVRDLANHCKKQITIIDACRGYSHYSNFTGLSGIGTLNFDYTNLGVARTVFQEYAKKCSNGRVLLYASQKGQNADDTKQGGYFSTNLLISARELSNTSQKLVSSICETFNQTYPKIQNKHQPDIEYTDDNALNLPFAIKAGTQLGIMQSNVKDRNSVTTEEVLGIALGTVAVIGITAILVDLLTGNRK